MAISVKHSPNLANYGKATQQAAGNVAAQQQMQQYASYLAGVQQANQQYGLGLGQLQLSQKTADRDYSLAKFDSKLKEQMQGAQIARMQSQSETDLIRAYADKQAAMNGLIRFLKT